MTEEITPGESSPEQHASEQTPISPTPVEGEQPAGPGDGTTPGGYSYTVVDDAVIGAPSDAEKPGGWSGARLGLGLLALALVPAVIVAVGVWLLAGGSGGGGSGRVNADVTNVLNAFSSGRSGTVSTRYEGELAPGYPAGIPSYPGARLLSSVAQISGNDAGFLVIYDTKDSRNKVTAYFGDKLAQDPWQVEAGQDGVDSALHQFSKIDDPNITGLVLAAQSKGDDLTTIVVSVQVASGANNAKQPAYTPAVGKTLPSDFPEKVSPYPDATLIETAFQKRSGGRAFNVSYITKDDTSKVLDYYRSQLAGNGLTVADGDASSSSLANASAVQFTDNDNKLSGEVIAGTFAEDESYTRIDVQATSAN